MCELINSVIRTLVGGREVWYRASPSRDGQLVLRRIPALIDLPWAEERRVAPDQIQGDQYSIADLTRQTGLPVASFRISEPEGSMLVVRRLLEGLPRLDTTIDGAVNAADRCGQMGELVNTAIVDLGDNWRVHDNNGEGVLFVGDRVLHPIEGNPLPAAATAPRNLAREVGLSYALFNHRHQALGEYRVVSYESPLLRPVHDGAGLKLSCDLVAYGPENQLVAVEVKVRPENAATRIEHGILQAIAYGYALKGCLHNHGEQLQQQVATCLQHWLEEEGAQAPVNGIAFAVAAPAEYFRASLQVIQKEWLRQTINQADQAGLPFAGFWALGNGQVEGAPVGDNGRVCPIVEGDVQICPTVDALVDHLAQVQP